VQIYAQRTLLVSTSQLYCSLFSFS